MRRIFWRYWLRRMIRQHIGCVGFGRSVICGVAMQGKENFWRYWLSRSRARRCCCDDGFGSVCGCVGFGCVASIFYSDSTAAATSLGRGSVRRQYMLRLIFWRYRLSRMIRQQYWLRRI